MVALLGGRTFGGSWSVGISLSYSSPSPSMAALVWVDILCQASSTMTDWALWNREPKLTFSSTHYFCWVFGQHEEKNNEYTRRNLQRTSPPVSKENLRHHHSDPWFLILIFRGQKQEYFRFEGSLGYIGDLANKNKQNKKEEKQNVCLLPLPFLACWHASKILGYRKYRYSTLESEMTNICMGN